LEAYLDFQKNDIDSSVQKWYKNYGKFGLLVIGKNILWNQYFRNYYNSVKTPEEKAIKRTIIDIVPFDIKNNEVKPYINTKMSWIGDPIHTLDTKEFSVSAGILMDVQQIVVEYDGKEFPLVLSNTDY
jgi:hypothetical protein